MKIIRQTEIVSCKLFYNCTQMFDRNHLCPAIYLDIVAMKSLDPPHTSTTITSRHMSVITYNFYSQPYFASYLIVETSAVSPQ